MFCPQCGTNGSEELKFCKSCGANLQAVRQVVSMRETEEKFDWSKTWVAEMLLSEGERKKREQELEHLRGMTPEVKRYNEIKAGVVTSCVGLGVAIFLYFLMQGIILSGQNPPGEAEILGRVWIAGVIPFLIGISLMINGIFVSKKLVEAVGKELPRETKPTAVGGTKEETGQHFLDSGDTTEFVSPNLSVTENTTKHLRSSGQK